MPSIRRRGLLALGSFSAAALAAPALRAQTTAVSPVSIADTLAGDNRFTRLLDLATKATAVQEFRGPGPMTVFAPTDDAFRNAPAGIMQDLMTLGGQRDSQGGGDSSQRIRWLALIQYHIVPGAFTPQQLAGTDRRLRTRNGNDISVSTANGMITVRNPAPLQQFGGLSAFGANFNPQPARQVGPEIVAANGIVYPVDQILWP